MNKLIGIAGGTTLGAILGGIVGSALGYDFQDADALLELLSDHEISQNALVNAFDKIEAVDGPLNQDKIQLVNSELADTYSLTPDEISAFDGFVNKIDHDSYFDSLNQIESRLAESGALGTLVGGGAGAVIGYNKAEEQER